jgi:hypothetical protein
MNRIWCNFIKKINSRFFFYYFKKFFLFKIIYFFFFSSKLEKNFDLKNNLVNLVHKNNFINISDI